MQNAVLEWSDSLTYSLFAVLAMAVATLVQARKSHLERRERAKEGSKGAGNFRGGFLMLVLVAATVLGGFAELDRIKLSAKEANYRDRVEADLLIKDGLIRALRDSLNSSSGRQTDLINKITGGNSYPLLVYYYNERSEAIDARAWVLGYYPLSLRFEEHCYDNLFDTITYKNIDLGPISEQPLFAFGCLPLQKLDEKVYSGLGAPEVEVGTLEYVEQGEHILIIGESSALNGEFLQETVLKMSLDEYGYEVLETLETRVYRKDYSEITWHLVFP